MANTGDAIQKIIDALADDLNTIDVVKTIESWVDETLNGAIGGDKVALADCLDALLGLKL